MNNDTWMLILLLARLVFGALVAIAAFSNQGQPGQHQEQGRGRRPAAPPAGPRYRGGAENLPLRPLQPRAVAEGGATSGRRGLVLGCIRNPPRRSSRVKTIHPLIPEALPQVDPGQTDDIHCLMIAASGVGKTAYFLYPNLEYACASGMSFFASDTKGDLARNYRAIARDRYGYQVAVVDLGTPPAQMAITCSP